MFFSTLRATLFGLLLLMPVSALAQGQTPPAASDQQLLKAEELDALVAPIALYPDTLLAEVLMASTYPLEVVQADRWTTENKTLKGDQLKTAVDKLTWDDSVKSLIATPSVLTMMSTKLDWTQKLGDAVLAQQPDVMDAVQRLRTKAQANNKLQSTKEQKVSVKQEQSKQVIVIEPAVPIRCTCPTTIPAWFTAPGHIRAIRRTTSRRRMDSPRRDPGDRNSVRRWRRRRPLGIRRLLGRRCELGQQQHQRQSQHQHQQHQCRR